MLRLCCVRCFRSTLYLLVYGFAHGLRAADGRRPEQAGPICFDVGGGEVACAPLAPMKVQSIDNADVAQLDRA
jgi:hypothetical protein